MTAIDRVRRAQRRLAVVIVAAAVLAAGVAGTSVLTVGALVHHIAPLPEALRALVLPLAVVAAVVVAAAVLWRGRGVRSAQDVALWIEAREPRLEFALVSAIDPRTAPLPANPALHAIADSAGIEAEVGRAARRTLGRALLALVVVIVLLVALRPGALLRAARVDLLRRIGGGASVAMANRLAELSARVEPPPYARMSASTVDQPASVAALVGSRIVFSAPGGPDGLAIAVGADSVRATADGAAWRAALTMPPQPAVVAFRDRSYHRLVALDPRPDSAPTARLLLPASDTTWQRVPHGRLAIEADLGDDIGLAYGYVEYLLSSGSEESFETKQILGARHPLGNARAAHLREAIDLDTLKLAPGSVLHVRVVSFDFNDVTGPGKGVSETRTLRVAEPIDSTSINAAPPLPIDSMWVSQRLLNMRTDTLIRAQRRLARPALVEKSTAYGNQQEDIRRRALAVIAILEDNGVGGSFATETSTRLREAVDLMWTARTDLGIAEPDSAMPSMKKILAILDEIRLAHRYYLRGLVAPLPVNVERVRLAGGDSARSGKRQPRHVLDDPAAALASRVEVAATLAARNPGAAIDSLVYIRVAALTTAPRVAATIDRAIALLRRGAPADSALALTRRALEPPARAERGAAEWGGIAP